MEIYHLLNPLIKLTEPKHTIDVLQNEGGKILNANTLLWNEKNMEKWTHFSPKNEGYCENWNFSKVWINCPSEKQTYYSNNPPDLYFSLSHVNYNENIQPVVSQFIIFAIAKDLPAEALQLISSTSDQLIEISNPMFVAELASRWVTRKTEFGSVRIDSPNSRHFFIENWQGDKVPDVSDFKMNGAIFEIVKTWNP